MNTNSKIWVIIPARSGSKTIKNKNLQKINGKSLIEHSIISAKKIKYVDKIILKQGHLEFTWFREEARLNDDY